MLTPGTSYYPELVDPEDWERDLLLMKDTGISLIRMLDFAWTAIEPREGEYDFDWLDAFLELATKLEMQIILCTPTATPPAWLVKQYPQIMIELRDGRRCTHGARREVCVNSPIYRHFSEELARVLGERYGQHDCVVGWQIDNELMGPEYNPPECHCPECHWQFRAWLKQRYESVEKLNEKWFTRFWNQEFSDWGEIGTPRHFRSVTGHVLDYQRFFNDSQAAYIKLQYDALREHIAEGQFITHNSTGMFDRAIDHMDYAKVLDYAGWDAYFGAAGHPYPEAFAALAHDTCRSALQKPFLVLETGCEGNSAAYLAEMRARGAKAITFWHWRQHRGNAENRCRSFCDYDGRPYPKRREQAKAFFDRIKEVPDLPEHIAPAAAGIFFSADCVRAQHRKAARWEFKDRKPIHHLDAMVRLYRPFQQHAVMLDVIQPDGDWGNRKLLIAPGLELISEDQAGVLRQFVADGGVLFACAPGFHKDEHGVYYPTPGLPLQEVLGVQLEDVQWNGAKEVLLDDGRAFAIDYWAEPATAAGAKVLGTFAGTDRPAVFENSYGKGKAFYMACISADLPLAIAPLAAAAAGLDWLANDNELVSIVRDVGDDQLWYLNHGEEPVTVGGHKIAPGDFVRS